MMMEARIIDLLTITFVSLLIMNLHKTTTALDCHGKTIDCYNCDSRFDDYCAIIDTTNQTTTRSTKRCNGCCVEFFQRPPIDGEKSVQRVCSADLVINYYMVGKDCLVDRARNSQMCFCNDDLCNRGAL